MHLLIPFAACLPDGCRQTWAGLALPHLAQLLATLSPLDATLPTVSGAETSLSPPHERALAAGLGWGGPAAPWADGISPLADGLLPWAALHAHRRGLAASTSLPWAVITPVNWSVQTGHIIMTDPDALALDEADSKTLLAAMQPYFAQDGIALYDDTPGRWLAAGEVFRGLPTASIDRAIGRNVQDWQPIRSEAQAPQAKLLRRLQSEMQMLLYTHPLTDQRSARGLPAVNSFWVSGTGTLPEGHAAVAPSSGVTVADSLRGPALREDWAAWGRAWQDIDAQQCAALLTAVQARQKAGFNASLAGETAERLTLCGERQAITWENRPQSAWERLRRNVSGKFNQSLNKDIHSML